MTKSVFDDGAGPVADKVVADLVSDGLRKVGRAQVVGLIQELEAKRIRRRWLESRRDERPAGGPAVKASEEGKSHGRQDG